MADTCCETCPRCRGLKGGPAFVDTADSGWYEPFIPCSLCKGEGTLTAEQMQRYEEGRWHREKRLARGESLRQCAHRLGVSPAAVSAYESRLGPCPFATPPRRSPPMPSLTRLFRRWFPRRAKPLPVDVFDRRGGLRNLCHTLGFDE